MGEAAESFDTHIADLEKQFTVSRDKLKEISSRFVEELEEGLSKDESNIPMNLTWVTRLPTGHETGTFLALDMGGTNLRVCKVTLLEGKGKHEIEQSQYEMGEEMKTGTAEQMYAQIGESLEKFLRDHGMDDPEEKWPLGFTFSYPTTQESIDHGILQRWTKGLDISGVEGEDVAAQLGEELDRRKLPVQLVALINDTTGALMASAYSDPSVISGAIFGTGCNGAYMEHANAIPKARHLLPQDDPNALMAINCEYGAFDNSLTVLPRTIYDDEIDSSSPKPGEQAFEKMSAGLYLGELLRLVLLDLRTRGIIFKDSQPSSSSSGTTTTSSDDKLSQPYIIDTAVLSGIENDDTPDLTEATSLIQDSFNINATPSELAFLQKIAVLIAVRGARLSACGVAAICLKTGTRKGHVAADGSVVNKHPRFIERWTGALGEILGWGEGEQRGKETPIKLVSAEDGSGVGAAVIAAITLADRDRGAGK